MTGGHPGKTKPKLIKKPEKPHQPVTSLNDAENAAHKLIASELRYRRLFETAQDGILILDAVTGKIIEVNPYLEEMLGYSHEEFIGKRLWEIGSFKDIELNQEAFQRLRNKGYARYENLPLETKNGHQISVEFVSNAYPIDGERVIQCNIRDITERKRAEAALATARNELETRVKQRTSQLSTANEELVQEIDERKRVEKALRESQERYKELADLLPQTVFEIDVTGNFVFANRYGLETSGYTQQDIDKGLNAIQLFIPKERNRVKRNIRRIFAGERLGGIAYTAMRKDSSTFPVLAYSAPIVRGDKVVGLRGLLIDITEYKQAEKALRESEERYRSLIHLGAEVGEAIVMLQDEGSKEGVHVFCNETWPRITGYSNKELLNISFFDLVHPKDLNDSLARHRKKISGKSIPGLFEITIIRKDGTEIPVEVTTAYTTYRGKATNVAYLRDISERKQAEEELQKVAKLESISTLAGGIAHDFNNLLTGILGNITLAERYAEKRGKIYDRLVDAERASMRAKELTQQLLTFSEGGAPIKKPTSIATLVKESASFALSGSNVKCDFSLPDGLWAVEVDKEQISRVIANVVINADQAMPQGGMISIRAENTVIKGKGYLPLRKGKYLRISIKDNGTGIPEQHLARIFEPYFTTKQKGHGLGLATAYSIIKNHGGYMNAESELGVGTIIHIYVPSTTKPISIEDTTVEEGHIGGMGRILVMDDEEMIRDLLHNSLSEVGYEIEFAGNGTEAIKKFIEAEKSGRKFDAVILDLTIRGGMGGKDTIKKLIELDPNVKAIASSGYANDAVLAEFKEYGFSGVVTKPYNVAVMHKILRDIMRTSESKKAIQERSETREDYSTGRTKILVMDDVPAVTTALGEILSDLGYEVKYSRNGDEATSMYQKEIKSGHSFDVVLMDLNISGGPGGEETIHRLIEIDPDIRAIVTSGYPAEPAMIKPERFGFRAAIAKPYRIEELDEVMHRLIEGEN